MNHLTESQQRLADLFGQGKLAPDDASVSDCQAVAAWFLDTKQDFKAVIALQEAKRLLARVAPTKGAR